VNNRYMKVWFASCVAIALLVSAAPAANGADLTALVHETQKMSQEGGGAITMVWWMPEEYWAASLAQAPNVTPAQTDQIMKAIRPYVMVAVVKGTISPMGSTFESEDYARTNTKLIDSKGNSYSPVADGDIDATAKSILAVLKPTLANSMGALGQNFHILLFPAEKDGQRLIDAKQKGQFKIAFADKEFKWRLPLDAVLPAKTCPKCHEECKGSWGYCPWCGGKLEK
jgi:hypothetical protein